MKREFDPGRYYKSYPRKVISRPGYPARAAFKSTLMFGLYGHYLFEKMDEITNYADIGGCFGFGANAMAFHISQRQGRLPKSVVFEISKEFVKIGSILFPHIEFIEGEFSKSTKDCEHFDLVTLFDLVEHVLDPESLLRQVASRSRYVMLLTPMETTGEWRGNKAPINQGENHEDGHINFFSPSAYETMLKMSDLDILESRLIKTIGSPRARKILFPEQADPVGLFKTMKSPKKLLWWVLREFPWVPWKLKQKITGGGAHICIWRSRLLD